MHTVRTYAGERADFAGKTPFGKKVAAVKEKYLTMGDLFSRIVKVIVK